MQLKGLSTLVEAFCQSSNFYQYWDPQLLVQMSRMLNGISSSIYFNYNTNNINNIG